MKSKILIFTCILLMFLQFPHNTKVVWAEMSETEVTENEEISEELPEPTVDTSETTEVEELNEAYDKYEEVENDELIEEEKAKKKTEHKKNKKKYTKRELKMLASVIFLEAGNQSFKGKLAVGNVVLDRVANKNFPNTIEGVIYHKIKVGKNTYYQFNLAKNGKLDHAMSVYGKRKIAWEIESEKECIKAAKAALSGKRAMDRKYHFFMMYNTSIQRRKPDGVKLEDHYFYNW